MKPILILPFYGSDDSLVAMVISQNGTLSVKGAYTLNKNIPPAVPKLLRFELNYRFECVIFICSVAYILLQ